MNRKDVLRAALGASTGRELPGGNSGAAAAAELPDPSQQGPIPSALGDAAAQPPSDRPRPLVRSGAVGAMGRSLGRIAHAAEEARALVAAGDKVVELDPSLVEISFITDRLDPAGGEHASFVESIRERGQQVPILVRPHPERPNHFQVAYGHRRLRAAIELGRPVRAVVKPLSDEELVVAQGQENSARTDLSYIERALFAIALEDRGFERPVIMTALNMDKTQLSRLISIGRAVPAHVVTTIGPAPKAGRPRWQALVEALGRNHATAAVERTLKSADFRALDSDARFAHLLAALTTPVRSSRGSSASTMWRNPEGRIVVRVDQTKRQVHLTVDELAAPDFGAYLIENLDDLYATFTARKAKAEPS